MVPLPQLSAVVALRRRKPECAALARNLDSRRRAGKKVKRYTYASLGYGAPRDERTARRVPGVQTLKAMMILVSGGCRVAGRIIERVSRS